MARTPKTCNLVERPAQMSLYPPATNAKQPHAEKHSRRIAQPPPSAPPPKNEAGILESNRSNVRVSQRDCDVFYWSDGPHIIHGTIMSLALQMWGYSCSKTTTAQELRARVR